MKHPRLVWLAAAAALLTGCSSPTERRISAHQETWQRLSEADQRRLRQERVRNGDTEEMVTIALGAPDKVVPATGPKGEKRTAWLYEPVAREAAPLPPASDYYDGPDQDSMAARDFYRNLADSRDPPLRDEAPMTWGAKKIIFQDGVVVNRPANPKALAELHGKVEAFRAKYDLPPRFRLTNPVQIQEFRAILESTFPADEQ